MIGSWPKGMRQTRATVLRHKRVALDHYLVRLKVPHMAKRAKPGQFLHVLCEENPTTTPLLRRPFSLLDVNLKQGTVDFIYKVMGFGTDVLTQFKEGSKMDCLGPVGTGFVLDGDIDRAYLVGGGVGIPPMYLLAKTLLKEKQIPKSKIHVFLGARTRDWIICEQQFKKLGVRVHVATDDGSLGTKGSVVDALKQVWKKNKAGEDQLFVCGPTPMMAAAAKAAKTRKIATQVSLEERMGCAMGACWGCVVEMADQPKTAHKRFQRVCTEGPVFDAQSILWEAAHA